MSQLTAGEYNLILDGVRIHDTVRGLRGDGPAAGDVYLLPDYAADVEALRIHLGLENL